VLQNEILYKFGQDNKFRCVLQLEQVINILQELHSGVYGGHFYYITLKLSFDVNYWWPTMNKDVHEFYRTYDMCQQTCSMLAQNMAKLVNNLPK